RAINLDLPGGPIEVPFARTAGVCDGNVMQSAGLACIDTVGVRGGGLHTPEEWIEIDSLTTRCQALALLMLRLQPEPVDAGRFGR
ncbi:MAG: hypothetical protein KF873_23795, partial [Gemmataceae bacterium]|nr:hypothetical protein [Gemmataceae bacterium]